VWIYVMYCASFDLIISVTDIDAVAGWAVGTELELAADEDILAANSNTHCLVKWCLHQRLGPSLITGGCVRKGIWCKIVLQVKIR